MDARRVALSQLTSRRWNKHKYENCEVRIFQLFSGFFSPIEIVSVVYISYAALLKQRNRTFDRAWHSLNKILTTELTNKCVLQHKKSFTYLQHGFFVLKSISIVHPLWCLRVSVSALIQKGLTWMSRCDQRVHELRPSILPQLFSPHSPAV